MFAPDQTFVPHRLARGGHRQTLAGAALPCSAPRPSSRADATVRAIPMRCGARLEAVALRGSQDAAVALLHGLGGSVDSPYLRGTFDALAREGVRVLAVAQRGSGGALESSDRPYMTGHVADAADVVRWLRAEGARRVLVIGFSISGNTVLKLMAEADETRPDAAIAVAPPIDLDRASREIARFYDLWILRSCRRWIPRLRGADAGIGPVPRLSGLRTFDERYIGPVWGFPDLSTYYRSASAATRLVDIDRPTLVLQALDDPVVRPERLLETPRSASVHVDLQPSGGHLGYVASDGARLGVRRWLPETLARHVRAFTRSGMAPRLRCVAP